jgi:hypothetical protein
MSRIAYCPACSAQEHGVKTRIPWEHTCGLERGEINPDIPVPKIKTWAQRLVEEQGKQSGKVIISSAALYKFLSERMEFWKEEVKIVGTNDELIIDGFKGMMCHSKAPFETSVYVDKLRQLRRLLGTITDQPITMNIDGLKIELQYITI